MNVVPQFITLPPGVLPPNVIPQNIIPQNNMIPQNTPMTFFPYSPHMTIIPGNSPLYQGPNTGSFVQVQDPKNNTSPPLQNNYSNYSNISNIKQGNPENLGNPPNYNYTPKDSQDNNYSNNQY